MMVLLVHERTIGDGSSKENVGKASDFWLTIQGQCLISFSYLRYSPCRVFRVKDLFTVYKLSKLEWWWWVQLKKRLSIFRYCRPRRLSVGTTRREGSDMDWINPVTLLFSELQGLIPLSGPLLVLFGMSIKYFWTCWPVKTTLFSLCNFRDASVPSAVSTCFRLDLTVYCTKEPWSKSHCKLLLFDPPCTISRRLYYYRINHHHSSTPMSFLEKFNKRF